MKLLLLYLITILLLTFIVGAIGQEPPKAVLVDEFANSFCTDEIRTRIDGFLVEIQQRPQSVGYIIENADTEIPGRFQMYFRTFQSHLRFRGFDPERILFFRGPDMSEMRFQYWIVPHGAIAPDIPKEFRQERIEKSTLFDASEISSIRKRTVEFGEASFEPCDLGLDLNQFAITVNANRDIIAFLIASSKGRRDVVRVKTALRLTTASLTKLHGIPADRIKTVFAGSRGRSEMQFWLVPKGSPSPQFREGFTR